jgi:cytochrome c5
MKNNILNLFSFFLFLSLFQLACSGGVKKDYKAVDIQDLSKNQPEVHGTEVKEGEITFSNPLNADMVKNGQNIYDLKCMACHKLTNEKDRDGLM